MIRVNNTESNAYNYEWMVVRMVDNEFWYYGSWRDVNKAAAQAVRINGIVIPSSMVEEA